MQQGRRACAGREQTRGALAHLRELRSRMRTLARPHAAPPSPRMSTMSEAALITRAKRISNLTKLRSFIKVGVWRWEWRFGCCVRVANGSAAPHTPPARPPAGHQPRLIPPWSCPPVVGRGGHDYSGANRARAAARADGRARVTMRSQRLRRGCVPAQPSRPARTVCLLPACILRFIVPRRPSWLHPTLLARFLPAGWPCTPPTFCMTLDRVAMLRCFRLHKACNKCE